MNQLDLNNLGSDHKYSVSIEPGETQEERYVRLFKDVVLFLTTIGFVVLVVWICFEALRGADKSADEKRWAMSVLTAITGGLVGYLVRK